MNNIVVRMKSSNRKMTIDSGVESEYIAASLSDKGSSLDSQVQFWTWSGYLYYRTNI